MERIIQSTHLPIFHLICSALLFRCTAGESPISPQQLVRGFRAVPDPSFSSFQPILSDSTGNYSLGFLRLNRNELTLSVIHVPSSVSFWSARTSRPARWGDPTELFFNGSLVLSDSRTGIFWSTDTDGERVWLSDTSNLQIQKGDGAAVIWDSFNFPSDTLVENQRFSSNMSLVSFNGKYSMRLGSEYFGLYADFKGNSDSNSGQMYMRHGALEAKADIVPDQPLFLVLKPDGYLGMFQNSSVPVDVESFNSFQQNATGILRLRIEDDGNLKGYYWTGSSWVLDYQAISESCQLPASCGTYGLCKSGKECSCLDNRTAVASGGCYLPDNVITGNFCGSYDQKFKVIRRTGVELPFKELMSYEKSDSLQQCETMCEHKCTCWGAVYSNSSGFCYTIESPIQTLVSIGDETKTGYFKVREGVGKKRVDTWLGLGLGLVFGAIVIIAGVLGVGWYRMRRRGVKQHGEGGDLGIGPYKDLGAASFRSIEMT